MIHALATAASDDLQRLQDLMQRNDQDKVEQVLEIYRKCGIDNWANELKLKYLNLALSHLESIVVSKIRKEPLVELSHYLIQREK
jgi:geranylgeranyl diphosphate synthase type II